MSPARSVPTRILFFQNALIVCVASMRIRPCYPCTLLFPTVSAPYVLHHRELDTLTVCVHAVGTYRFGGLRKARRLTTSRNLVLFAPDWSVQVREPSFRARPRAALAHSHPVRTRTLRPLLTCASMRPQVSAPMGRLERRLHARRQATDALPSSIRARAERRCSALVRATAAPSPHGRVRGAPEA